ncbi:hypothetical protein B0J13DRAFT_30322 [Dactylonectria estremocensis]|uniref:ML-like domain-containing protein n=1 Tax=Dactylonectria estremocensis TaxID=1079267 RepID=A0A9P9FJ15_9HYPO|nr:hypothetical protein B0J13DRAFT_30322 [Dactylonectria estremocensis]
MVRFGSTWSVWKVAAVATTIWATGVLGSNVLETSGFSDCGSEDGISVKTLDLKYDEDSQTVVFNLAGYSNKERNVSAALSVIAYGNEVYQTSFNPCKTDTYIQQLCPLPSGDFSASGTQEISDEWAGKVPSIAFQVPDISAQATLKLISLDTEDQVACIQSEVTNGKTISLPAIKYVAVGIIGASFALSGVSAALSGGGGGSGGSGTPSPSFAETLGWFQGMAMNGMLSVDYPPVYRSFTKNFGFSAGIIPWSTLQTSIDNFRSSTGGNLTNDSFEVLQNATLVYADNSTSSVNETAFRVKRALTELLLARDDSDTDLTKVELTASGIAAYAQQLSVPKSNTFMTVLLIVAIVVAAIVVGILLVKVILEFWALFGSFPKSLAGFRTHYWGSIARAITSLILLLYGIWVLYCVFQFTQGDSWAAKTLAGVTLFIFTATLAFFSWKIWSTARKLKNAEGDPTGLYQDKEIWVKYSLFYESYKKDYWWLFVPTIVYLFAKGCTLAVGDGHGMSQTIAQLVVEACMLILLCWSRPFERKSGNVIGIAIQTVRVLSVICILVFVEQFGIAQTTKTVAGVVLIAVQSTLTGLLVILIAWNAISACIRENPHRKRRKEMEKLQRDMDTLTPLDARNSLLLDRKQDGENINMFPMSSTLREKDSRRSFNRDRYSDAEEGYQTANLSASPPYQRNLTQLEGNEASQGLVQAAAPVGWVNREPSPMGAGRYDNYGGYNNSNQQSYGYAKGGGYRGF